MSESHTTETGISNEAIKALATGMRGACFTPGDAGYDDARIIWNGSIDKHPGVIAGCAGVADVIDCLLYTSPSPRD